MGDRYNASISSCRECSCWKSRGGRRVVAETVFLRVEPDAPERKEERPRWRVGLNAGPARNDGFARQSRSGSDDFRENPRFVSLNRSTMSDRLRIVPEKIVDSCDLFPGF